MAQLRTDMTFTRSAKAQQERLGSRENDQRGSERGGFHGEITPELAEFIEQRTSAYLGTANSSGQPCIQHRGGAPGFLCVLDKRTPGVKAERALLFHVEAWDKNCRQHIPQRVPASERVALRQRISELENRLQDSAS